MRKGLAIILVVTLLGFIANPVLSAGTLKFTTPNVSKSWTTGKKYTIKWSKGNAGAYVKIQLLKSGKDYKTIKAKTKNDGRHRWKIPASVKAGSAYKIRITSVSKKTVKDQSDKTFTITKASTTTTGGGSDTIEVTSPNGGESWTTGNRYTINWDKGDGKGKVKIELLKSGKAYKTIKTRTKNDGKQRWKVPSSVKTGSAYKIKITSKTDTSNTDSSDSNFTIDSTFTVTYDGNGNTGGSIPADGNTYEPGATVTIKGNTGKLTKKGYKFLGWNTASNRTGTDYVEEATFTPKRSIVLYAKWVASGKKQKARDGNEILFFVYYNGNGNTGGQPPSMSTHCPPSCTNRISKGANLSKSGYTFDGWNTAADGSGTAYAAGSKYYEPIDLSLYAQWTATSGAGTISGTIWFDFNEDGSFDSNEGIGSVRVVYLDLEGRQRQTYMTHVSGGNYSFGSLDAGTQYTVSIENIWPHLQSHLTPASVSVTLSPDEERTVNFGFTSPCEGLPSYQGCP